MKIPSAYTEGYAKARAYDPVLADLYMEHTGMEDPVLDELTDNWTRYFDERYKFRRDTDFIIANLTGLESLEYSLDAGSEGGITDPDYLRTVDAFARWFREQPEVSYVQAFPDIMKRLNRNMHGDDAALLSPA